MRRVVTPLLVAALVVTACTPGARVERQAQTEPSVAIGAFDFPESELIAELYAQALERAGVEVERLGALGPREVVAPALLQGAIDVVPEYLGSAIQFIQRSSEPSSSRQSTTVLDGLLAPSGASALPAARASNTNVIVVQRAFADDHALGSVSDLRPIAARLVLGGPPECPERPACLRGLEGAYGLRFSSFLALEHAGAVVAALEAGEIQVGVLFSTDAQLSPMRHVVLTDDRNLQPDERVVPVARDDALEAFPAVRTELNRLGQVLTTSDLRVLNRAIQLEGRPVEEAVRDWLEARAPLMEARS
jgi:osmoprotectant transport system substrate-binding protein